MSKRSQEKRRTRAKEKAKLARKQRGASPLLRLASDEAQIHCWVQFDPQAVDRMENIAVIRPVKGGRFATAFFMVDYQCIGLDTAFFRLDLLPGEVLEHFRDQSRRRGWRLTERDLAQVRATIGAAVRWTTQHGFRLPQDTHRCLKILGHVNVDDADTSAFGAEGGGLRFVGSRRDLEKRLIGESLDDFTLRDDVQVTFMDDANELMDEDDDFDQEDELDEEGEFDEEDKGQAILSHAARSMRDGIIGGVRAWCASAGRPVEELLNDAADVHILATAAVIANRAKGDFQTALKHEADELIACFHESDQDRAKLRAAYDQLAEFLETLPPGTGELPMDVGDDFSPEPDGSQKEHEEAQAVVHDAAEQVRARFKEGVTRWCFAHGQNVHPRIDDAIALMLDSMMQVNEGPDEEVARKTFQASDALLSLESDADRQAILEANAQLASYVGTFESPEAMMAAFHLDDDDDDHDLQEADPEEAQGKPPAPEEGAH